MKGVDHVNDFVIDFVLVGASKCASSSLYAAIGSHPDIFLSYEKELNLFAETEVYKRGPQWWKTYYKGYAELTSRQIIGNCHNIYFCDVDVPDRIKKHNPNVNILAIIRDPVRRAWSHYLYLTTLGLENRTFEDAIKGDLLAEAKETSLEAKNGGYLTIGLYGQHLERFFNKFKREQLYVLFTEDLASDPAQCLKSLFEFLGVDAGHIPPKETLEKKRASRPVIPFVAHMLTQLTLLPKRKHKDLLYKFIGRKGCIFLKRIIVSMHDMNLKEEEKKYPNKDIVQLLTAYYREDVERVRSIVGRVPDEWGF